MARAESSFADLRAAQRFALEIGALDDAFGLIASIREFAMRAMRYEVFAWADAACRVPGRARSSAAHRLLTGIRAYGAWVRGEFDLAVVARRGDAPARGRSRCTPSGLAERILGNVLYIVDRATGGNVEAARQIELAEESGNDSRLVHACYMGAVALSSEGVVRRGAATSSTRAREHAQTDAVPDRPRVGRGRARASRAEPRPTRSRRSSRADRIARRAGNRWMSAFARTEASGLLVAPRRGRRGLRGPRRDGRALVPRRRVVAAVAHAVALRDRAPPHRAARSSPWSWWARSRRTPRSASRR